MTMWSFCCQKREEVEVKEMQRTLMKSKIHRARVTGAFLDYEGSLSLDTCLLRAADILPYERVEVYNVFSGARFATYAIPAPEGSGEVAVNGAAARLACPGDLLIIVTYAVLGKEELLDFRPKVVFVDEKNSPREKGQHLG